MAVVYHDNEFVDQLSMYEQKNDGPLLLKLVTQKI